MLLPSLVSWLIFSPRQSSPPMNPPSLLTTLQNISPKSNYFISYSYCLWFWGLTGISEVWGVSYSGLLISDFHGFSEMVAASGDTFYTDCWLTPPLGFLPEHTPLCNQASSPYDLWFPRGRQGLKLCSSFRRHGVCLIYILLVRQFQRPEERRGDMELHFWMGGVSKNLEATF